MFVIDMQTIVPENVSKNCAEQMYHEANEEWLMTASRMAEIQTAIEVVTCADELLKTSRTCRDEFQDP